MAMLNYHRVFYIINLEEGIGSWMMLASFFCKRSTFVLIFGVCYVFSKFQWIPRAKLPQRTFSHRRCLEERFFQFACVCISSRSAQRNSPPEYCLPLNSLVVCIAKNVKLQDSPPKKNSFFFFLQALAEPSQ